MSLKVSDIGEKDLIKLILDNSKYILQDDAAITSISNFNNLISSTDMLIQSKHFPDEMTYFQMGFKSVTVNVSDLAAMGAEPLGFLLSIAIPRNLLVNDFKEIINGVLDACNFYKIPLIGGDTNEAKEIIISGTALGVCDNPILMSGFENGDLIAITGDVGVVAEEFKTKKFTENTLKPIARLKEGQYLKEIGASSATDITDGLISELFLLHAQKPDLGLMIYENTLKNKDLCFGEDFELLFTISKEKEDLIKDFIIIGEVNTSKNVEMTLEDGKTITLENKGYNHFKD